MDNVELWDIVKETEDSRDRIVEPSYSDLDQALALGSSITKALLTSRLQTSCRYLGRDILRI